jgi:hypothetical protein
MHESKPPSALSDVVPAGSMGGQPLYNGPAILGGTVYSHFKFPNLVAIVGLQRRFVLRDKIRVLGRCLFTVRRKAFAF